MESYHGLWKRVMRFAMPDKNDWRRDELLEPQEEEGEIRRRAYDLYEQRGRQAGLALEDWLNAEREIKTHKSWVLPRLGAA